MYLSLFCGVTYMLCIINCQYTHNQGKFCQNFQFFHIYSTMTSFSVNLHHFPVDKNQISVQITEISVNITEISVGMKRNFGFWIQNPFSFGISEIYRNFGRNSVSSGWRDSVNKGKGEPCSRAASETGRMHSLSGLLHSHWAKPGEDSFKAHGPRYPQVGCSREVERETPASGRVY